MSSETSTSRILRRLDRIEENLFMIQNDVIDDFRAGLRNLQKDLKEERDFRIEDISALSTRLTGSSGQASCEC
ncbi:hypothetical protein DPMN_188042 [Dreissena polymorpha]|uniref:Uncharacterized protein n=1 Tax=Dreissena polymorpha TaxID=45954 RepID=A0A9D4DRC3_DREPO|nr:hypothetical protein DPMN_188010 [Dreissena polymorpha]KAH3753406.1 hypothetical protein DPMN_188042 [Dreissena polymorpha]